MARRRLLNWLCAILLAGLTWEALGHVFPETLPPPSALYETLMLPGPRTDPVARQIPQDVLHTLLRMLGGTALAFATGVPIGILIARYRPVRWAAAPHLMMMNTVPHIAVLPILVIVFGFGNWPALLLVWSGVFVLIVVNTRTAVEGIDRSLVDRLRALKAGRIRTFRHLQLPSMVPALIATSRLAIGYAWALALLSETFGQHNGIGFLLIWYTQQGYLPGIFLAAATITLCAVLMELGISALEQRLRHYWPPRQAEAGAAEAEVVRLA
jgi:ABC-type nitrate/sulfonate/bicarbonate transport system permease component